VKINVAIAIGAAGGLALALGHALRGGPPREGLRDAAGFAAGWLLGFLPLALYFVHAAGLEEVYLQMVRDAASSKGGVLHVIGRAFPRVILDVAAEGPYRRPIELALSLALSGSLFAFWHARLSARRRAERSSATHSGDARLGRIAALYFALGVALGVASLFELPGVQAIRSAARPVEFVPSPFLLTVQLLYLASMTGCAVLAVRRSSWRDPALALPLLFVAAVSLGHALSSVNQVAAAAPVAVPLLFHLVERSHLHASGDRAGWALGALTLCLVFVFPFYVVTFERLAPLPDTGPFAGLFGRPGYRELTQVLVSEVAPRIRGERTLWLVPGGPHCALGGRPVRSVAILYPDTHHRRSEAMLREAWSTNPPEFVVLGDFPTAEGAEFLTPTGVRPWLEQEYTQVWEAREPMPPERDRRTRWSEPLSLWQKR
jgi:hypothetical protein